MLLVCWVFFLLLFSLGFGFFLKPLMPAHVPILTKCFTEPFCNFIKMAEGKDRKNVTVFPTLSFNAVSPDYRIAIVEALFIGSLWGHLEH